MLRLALGSAGGPGAGPDGDDRGAERCARSLRASWRTLAARDDRLTPAAVCNVSRTGIALLVGEALRPGAILIVRLEDLPEPMAAPRVAHIKHAAQQADGRWLVGCAFATPLTDDDLSGLSRPAGGGAAPPADAAATGEVSSAAAWTAAGAWDRRTSPRRGVPLVRVVIWEVRSGGRSHGWVADVSRGGLGLVALRAYPTGAVLRVRVVHADDVVPWVEVAVRSFRRKGQRWQLGCRFHGEPHPHSLGLLD
jgi:hypothetical protein